MIHQLRVTDFLLVDNNNALSLNGGTTGWRDYPHSRIENTTIIGKSLSDCDFCY